LHCRLTKLDPIFRCSLHGRSFRARAAALVRPTSAGGPDYLEERARRKRREKRAAPDLEQHLALIRENCREDFARTYQLLCDGVKREDIGAEFGISIQGAQGRLPRIAKVLSETVPRETRRNGGS